METLINLYNLNGEGKQLVHSLICTAIGFMASADEATELFYRGMVTSLREITNNNSSILKSAGYL